MKKALLLIVVALLTVVFAGCGVFSPPSKLPEDPIAGENPNKPSDGTEEDDRDIFTVNLICEDAPFYPTEPIFALWTGDEGVYMAQFDKLGVAQIADLDGEYRVTLSDLPKGYTYDVNGYSVDNTKMDTTIELLKIVSERDINSAPTDLYHCVNVEKMGTYRTVITSPNDWVYYEFSPGEQGFYSIESWVDITANDVNPQVRIYTGTSAMKYPYDENKPTIDEGGKCSTYTKNFRYEVSLRRDELGNVFTFAIGASKIGNTFPVTIDFTIKRERDVSGFESLFAKVAPRHQFSEDTKNKPAGTFTYIYKSTGNVLTDENIFYNPDDDYYHLDSPQGPVLYAKIGGDSEILTTDSKRGFLDGKISLKFMGKEYYDFIDYYDAYSNSDKVHPVTSELKEFLFNYSLNQRFFNDGNGWAELLGFNSNEEDQWLFNCGYYS